MDTHTHTHTPPHTHTHTHTAAKDSNVQMVSYHHHGVYGLINKGRWSCCANPRRDFVGCSPSFGSPAPKKGETEENSSCCTSILFYNCPGMYVCTTTTSVVTSYSATISCNVVIKQSKDITPPPPPYHTHTH